MKKKSKREEKKQKREKSQRAYYISEDNSNLTLANALKKYASRYYQLKMGHGAIGNFLAKIKAFNTWCDKVK